MALRLQRQYFIMKFLGTAGWAIAKAHKPLFDENGSHLERYARVFNAAEINSSFYRPHRNRTYAKWAGSVPEGFRFSAKVPKTITHENRLLHAEALLKAFLGEVRGLGEKLGVLLVQLAPSHRFDTAAADAFFEAFRNEFQGNIAIEPRHVSWASQSAQQLLQRYGVSQVIADPQVIRVAKCLPNSFRYWRFHGAPRIYYSNYEDESLTAFSSQMQARANDVWCIFDNTAQGFAIPNAIAMQRILLDSPRQMHSISEERLGTL